MDASTSGEIADTDETSPVEGQARLPKARSIRPLLMIWRQALQYPGRVILALIALTITAAATLAIPAYFKLIIDEGFSAGGDLDQIERAFQLMMTVVVVLALGTAMRFYFVSWLGERVVADIREKVQDNLLRLAPGFYEENSPKEISSRMTSDTTLIEQVVGTTVSVALRNILMAIGGTIYLFYLVPQLTMWMMLIIPLVVVPIAVFGRRLRNVSRSSQDRVADIGAMVTEVLGAMKIVQAFNQEAREQARFREAVERTFATARRRILIRAAMTAIIILIVFGAIVMLMWRGAVGVASGEISGGTIAALVITAGLVAAPALRDFTLEIQPGETVAIVGPSGAGKSTIFQLAERFYDPQAGTVRLDGVPLTSADPAEIRKRIAFVPQEGVLFSANARDNLRYGNWEATDDAIWEAARAANADRFLRALPQGLDKFLGENGTQLSGGQRQRVAIARALLRDSPILLLDEATSALDAESERLVQDALERLMADRTTLVIAHRLATVRAADRIVVMDEGRIVEQGSHGVLAAGGGLYSRLAALQFGATQAA
jgi:ATP-binding cassette, subfamily B, bacterial